MYYIAFFGSGDPNALDGEYQRAMKLLYGIAFTIKMSKLGDHKIDGYFEYVMPPLEGFWYADGNEPFDLKDKENFKWISVIRLPDFVTESDLKWAQNEATKKKKTDFSGVKFLTIDEGLCVQCLHIGSYDSERETIIKMKEYASEQGLTMDLTPERKHHEIYLSDPRKTAVERLKTVIRIPVKKP